MNQAELRAEIIAAQEEIETHLRAALLAAIAHLRRSRTIEEVALLLSQGRVEAAISTATMDEAARYWIIPALAAGLVRGASLQAQYIRELTGRLYRWDPRAYDALRVANEEAARQVQYLVGTYDVAAREAIVQAMALGASTAGQARALDRATGLSQRYVQWLASHERALRSMPESLSTAKLDRALDLYANRLRLVRVNDMALGGAEESLHLGMLGSALQARQLGFLDQYRLVKRWHSMGDHLVRDSHRAPLHGQVRELDEPFVSGHGALLMFPHDPSAGAAETRGCRCWNEVVSAADAGD